MRFAFRKTNVSRFFLNKCISNINQKTLKHKEVSISIEFLKIPLGSLLLIILCFYFVPEIALFINKIGVLCFSGSWSPPSRSNLTQ